MKSRTRGGFATNSERATRAGAAKERIFPRRLDASCMRVITIFERHTVKATRIAIRSSLGGVTSLRTLTVLYSAGIAMGRLVAAVFKIRRLTVLYFAGISHESR